MPNRSDRIKIARETLEICARGFYTNCEGNKVGIQPFLDYARSHTFHYRPVTFDQVFTQRDATLQARATKTPPVIEVTNETTLGAARRMVEQEHRQNVACLNFASAKNPGGGFRTGAQAQEESIARASGLYVCIKSMQEMYTANRKTKSALYTDHMLYSDRVPVFRDDADELLDSSYFVSIITAPAVNAGAIKHRGGPVGEKIAAVMQGRIEKILSIATIHNQQVLILGAWGCGVFKNSPEAVASYFKHYLLDIATFRGAFQKVVFAIYDRSPEHTTLAAFKKKF